MRWRDGSIWYAAVILGWPAVLLLCRVLSGLPLLPPSASAGAAAWIASGLAQLLRDPGPLEEIGWRGYALPLLQQRLGSPSASLLLGAVWGLWHLPAFYMAGLPQGAAYLVVPFVIGCILISIVMTSLYNATRGCIPLMLVFHASLNDPFKLGKSEVQVALFGVLLLAALLCVALGRGGTGSAKFVEAVP